MPPTTAPRLRQSSSASVANAAAQTVRHLGLIFILRCGSPRAMIYSYAAPEPQGFKDKPVRPDAAFYDRQLGEFLLMYDDVRKTESPTGALLEFCQSTYEAAATLGKWDRGALER